jgi:hypothetical protein
MLDLSDGPLALNIPDSKGRYFVVTTLDIIDAYTNIPFVVGTPPCRVAGEDCAKKRE